MNTYDIALKYEPIPPELKQVKHWCCYKAIPDEKRPGKVNKIPINAYTGGNAQSNNPETWSDYDTAVNAISKYSLAGIGMFFAPPYFGVDIDGVSEDIDKFQNTNEDNIISEFIHTLGSYAEYSPSGKGLHIICKGSLPKGGRRKNNVEMYESGRFFTMTGNIASEYVDIAECTESIKFLHEKYIEKSAHIEKNKDKKSPDTTVSHTRTSFETDTDIISLIKQSKQGAMFCDLYDGNWEKYYRSQSEADLAFCNILAFWTGRDAAAMDRIFRSSTLMRDKWDRIGEATIKKAIADCKSVYVPKSEYSIHIDAPAKQKLYSFDDTGNAERFINTYGEIVRFSYINNKWFFYDGRKWCQDNTGTIKQMVDIVIENMNNDFDYYIENAPQNIDINEYEKQFMKHLKQSRSNKSKTAMAKQAEHKVPILPDMFDRKQNLLNVTNGTVDLATCELMPHDKNNYITKITNCDFKSDCQIPLWEKFLGDIFNGDAELIRYIQKAVGYSLTGSTKEDCTFFCYGTGRNGKSTFLSVVSEALGEYAANIQPETIMVKHNSGGPTSDIARLKGARFVTTSEPNEGLRLNEGLVKQLTGGDIVTASKKYEDEFEFKPEFKLWMSTNHKPVVRGTDIGIWSRIRLIPFTVLITDDKMDKNLRYKLKKEMPGILRWAVEGCLMWQREGLKMPKAVAEATIEYKNEMDVLTSFLDECCDIGKGEEKTSVMYKAYAQWAKDSNDYIMSAKKFLPKMQEQFRIKKVQGLRYYSGLSLKREYQPYNIAIGGII